MSQKIKRLLISLIGALTLLTPALVPAVAHASLNNAITGNACSGVNNAAGGSSISLNAPTGGGNAQACTGDSAAGNTLGHLLNEVINIFSIVVGAVSVIMIIVGGFKYITSGGNDQGVASAKNTIMYALIGLVIVALAQIIVHYVLSRLGQAGG